MKIRVATEADIETMFDIRTSVRENFQSREELATLGVTDEGLREMLRSTSRAWLAEVEGRPAAFSMADAAQGTVFAMFVRPGFEGQGLGWALMRETEAWLFAQGWDEIWLLTGTDPTLRAHGFYRRLGWGEDGFQGGQVRYTKRLSVR